MKNKVMVMIITFVIMVALTPVIFGKFMNSRFDTMMLKLQQQKGILIKEVKDKSSYLTTDRIFEVKIPGSLLKSKELKYINLLTEVKFKNLPVTNVYFHNVVKNIILKSSKELPFLSNKIIFDVTTPDFKTYAFDVKPVKYQAFNLDAVKGVVHINKDVSTINIDKISLKDKKFSFNIINFKSVSQKDKNFFKTENKLDLKLKLLNKSIDVKNIDILSSLKTDKKASVNFKISFKNLMFSKIIEANAFNTKIKIYDLNSTLFDKAMNSKDKNLTLKLLSNGLKLDLNSSLKNMSFLDLNQGGFKLNVKAVIYKAKNLKEFENYFKKYLAVKIDADISQNFAKMLKDSFPVTRQFLNIPPDKNGIIHLRINLDRGAIK